MVIMTVFGSMAMPVSAAGTHYVGISGQNDAVSYDNLQDAVNNASSGDTIEVATGEYSTSVNVTTNNISIVRDSSVSSGTVTVNATQEMYGVAFYGEHDENLTLGTNVETVENTVTVDSANAEGTTGTYSNVSNAMSNVDSNYTISIVPGTYNESVNVTSKNVGIENSDPASGSVTIDATNTSEGQVFYGPNSDSVRIGEDITVKENVIGIGGGAIGNAATFQVLGIPMWAIVVVALILGYVYVEESG